MSYIRMLMISSVLALPFAAHHAAAFTSESLDEANPHASNFADPDEQQPNGFGLHLSGEPSGSQQGGFSFYPGNASSNNGSGMFGQPCNPSCTSRAR